MTYPNLIEQLELLKSLMLLCDYPPPPFRDSKLPVLVPLRCRKLLSLDSSLFKPLHSMSASLSHDTSMPRPYHYWKYNLEVCGSTNSSYCCWASKSKQGRPFCNEKYPVAAAAASNKKPKVWSWCAAAAAAMAEVRKGVGGGGVTSQVPVPGSLQFQLFPVRSLFACHIIS